MPHSDAYLKEFIAMPLQPRPADSDLLQRPALAAGVFGFSALAALGLSAVLTLAAPGEVHAQTTPQSIHKPPHKAVAACAP